MTYDFRACCVVLLLSCSKTSTLHAGLGGRSCPECRREKLVGAVALEPLGNRIGRKLFGIRWPTSCLHAVVAELRTANVVIPTIATIRYRSKSCHKSNGCSSKSRHISVGT
jgi:hypothetical protein